jgi:hypothetical protein
MEFAVIHLHPKTPPKDALDVPKSDPNDMVSVRPDLISAIFWHDEGKFSKILLNLLATTQVMYVQERPEMIFKAIDEALADDD